MSAKKNKPKQCTVKQDWDELRAQVVTYTFIQARRLRWDIYDALAEELYEAGCPISGYVFTILTKKENMYIEAETTHVRLKDDRKLLFCLYEKLKAAENALRGQEFSGKFMCSKELNELVMILEPLKENFEWCFADILKYAFNVCASFDGYMNNQEYLTRIYYKFGKYFGSKGEEMQVCAKVLERALVLCRGEDWLSDKEMCEEWGIFSTLHTDVAYAASMLFIKLGQIASTPELAAEYGRKAVSAVSEIGRDVHKAQYCRITVDYAAILIRNRYLDDALKALDRVQCDMKFFPDLEYDILWAVFNYQRGKAYTYQKMHIKALESLRLGLEKAHELKMHKMEIAGLKLIGENYGCLMNWKKARKTYDAARSLAEQIGDKSSSKLMIYLSSRLIREQLHAQVGLLYKTSRRTDPTAYHLFSEWKFKSIAFWHKYSVEDIKANMGDVPSFFIENIDNDDVETV